MCSAAQSRFRKSKGNSKVLWVGFLLLCVVERRIKERKRGRGGSPPSCLLFQSHVELQLFLLFPKAIFLFQAPKKAFFQKAKEYRYKLPSKSWDFKGCTTTIPQFQTLNFANFSVYIMLVLFLFPLFSFESTKDALLLLQMFQNDPSHSFGCFLSVLIVCLHKKKLQFILNQDNLR